jgi:hypothetical protein
VTTEDPGTTIRLAQDIGAIKQGVKTLGEGQKEVDRKITGLQRAIGDLVTRDDCRSHRADLADRVRRPVPSGSRSAIRERLGPLELLGRKAGAVTAIFGLLAMMVVGTIVVARFVSSLERALERDRVEQKRQTGQVLNEIRSREPQPIIIQNRPVVPPDAGTGRRRTRRKRRSTP